MMYTFEMQKRVASNVAEDMASPAELQQIWHVEERQDAQEHLGR